MNARVRYALLLLLVAPALAHASVRQQTQHAIYGDDSREEALAYSDGAWTAVAAQSVIAFIPYDALAQEEDGSFTLAPAPQYGESLGLCNEVPFVGQPAAAHCTGVLIDNDLVLTAGHCLPRAECPAMAMVFGYLWDETSGALPIASHALVECAEVIVHQLSLVNGPGKDDFAILRLSRPVDDEYVPVDWKLDALPPAMGAPLWTISAGAGLPLKIDDGGRVTVPGDGRSAIRGTLDTFTGSSGGPVFEGDGALLGILVRGQRDYTWERDRGCNALHMANENTAEEIQTLASVMDAACVLPAMRERERCQAYFMSRAPIPEPSPEDPEPAPHKGCTSAPLPGNVSPLAWILAGLLLVRTRRHRCRRVGV